MLLKKNKIYNQIVDRNGAEDPLKKTLLIIDEAHKIYSPTVAKSERPNTEILERMIQNSYDISGKDSVRVMLMTATPFTEDGMEMIQLLNLLRKSDKLPIKFEDFARTYLDDNGYFTKKGLQRFQDSVSGYISYLNRSQDARNFAHPVIQKVFVPMSIETIDESEKELKNLQASIKMLQADEKETVSECITKCPPNDKECVKNCQDMAKNPELEDMKARLKELQRLHPKNKYDPLIYELKQQIKELNPRKCMKEIKDTIKERVVDLKEQKREAHKKCNELPVKERKPCKDRAAAAFEAENSVLQKELNERSIECEKLKTQKEESKQKVKEYQGLKKQGKQELKALKARTNVYKTELKQKSIASKKALQQIKEELKRIRSIKDIAVRKATMKEFRNHGELMKNSKELKRDIKDLRADISKVKVQIKTKKITESNLKLKNISQQYALGKYCNV
jgi:myosin heavy subunit